jgi:hypothetical protein
MAVNEDDAVKTGTVERAPVQAPAVRKPKGTETSSPCHVGNTAV